MKLMMFVLSAWLLATSQPHAAEVKAFVTGAAQASFQGIAPQFERATGHKVAAEFDLPLTLIKKADAGEPYDIILSYDVAPLIEQGKLAADTRTVFGRVGVGIAVRQGAPKPDFRRSWGRPI